MIFWDQPGYVVAFTTRVGGVSDGVYASLNLTRGTGDDRRRSRRTDGLPANRSACRTSGSRSTVRSTRRRCIAPARNARRAGRRAVDRRADVPLLAMSADCLPIAHRAAPKAPARSRSLHAGWRGLSEGVVTAGVRALGNGPFAAVIGPAIGPCCYEVGPRCPSSSRRPRRANGKLDLWTAAERALRAAGVERVERVDLCTRATQSCSSPTGVTGARGSPRSDRLPSPEAIRERLARIQAEVGAERDGRRRDEVRPARGHRRARRGGRHRGGGEPRAGPRGEACGVRRCVPLALHRPAAVEQGEDRQPDLRARALARLGLGRAPPRGPGPRPGEPRRRGVEGGRRARGDRRPFSATTSAGYRRCHRPLRRPGESRAWFMRLRELAAAHGLSELSMGTTQDYAVAAEEGATYVRVGSILFRD